MSVGQDMGEVRAASEVVRSRSPVEPRVGIVLGTGLDGVSGELEDAVAVPYTEVPGLPASTLDTHPGRFVLGRLEEVPVCVMAGRFHRYEGHSLQEVTLPVRILRELGVETLVTTGICGSMHPLWDAGDFVLLADHINLMGDNPLVGPNLDAHGPRFPDMSEPYDGDLRALAREQALDLGISVREGVYVAVTGPSLETAAEYLMLRRLGADVVGMSTVPEVIVARHAGLRVLGVSVVTDVCMPDALEPVDVEEIMSIAADAEPLLGKLVRRVLPRLPAGDRTPASAR